VLLSSTLHRGLLFLIVFVCFCSVRKLEKEVETVNHLNEKKLATMKSINENNHKLEAEKLELLAVIEKKDERIQEEANAAA